MRPHMLTWLKEQRDLRVTARFLYGSIVTQARQKAFYADWGVPDTAEGRFEMVALHLVLALQRLAREGEPGQRLGQALTEAFVVDMDDIMREMTVGDLAVPRQVKRAVAAIYDRHIAYGAALTAGDEGALGAQLQARLASVAGGAGVDTGRLGNYVREADLVLAGQAAADLLAGRIDWPGAGARASAPSAQAQ